jgi:hypothetical protein
MTERIPRTDSATTQIDRLVSGDLPEADRRSLLAWLDEEPARWRSCALAFLEAQAWEQATTQADWDEQCGAVPAAGSGLTVQKGAYRPVFRWLQGLTLAGLLLLAFGAGAIAAHGWSSRPPPLPQLAQPAASDELAGPVLATVSVRTSLDPRLRASLTLPVEPADDSLPASSAVSEYVRKQLERRGYELSEETQYLPATMPDGRPVMVPVNKIRVRLKGLPVS